MEHWLALIRQLLATTWRQRWLLVATAWAVSLAGWAGVSMMPEDQLKQLTDVEIRDLLAYLAGPGQVPLPKGTPMTKGHGQAK